MEHVWPRPPYWSTLTTPRREKLFELMRQWDEEALEYMRRGREDPFTIPVGAALFDEVLQGAIRMELVSALQKAPSLEAVQELAGDAIRRWVENHNKRRPKDINWQRWKESGQAELQYRIRLIREIP